MAGALAANVPATISSCLDRFRLLHNGEGHLPCPSTGSGISRIEPNRRPIIGWRNDEVVGLTDIDDLVGGCTGRLL